MRHPLIRYVGAALLLTLLAASCTRRELWVYTDDLRQVELFTDWSLCDARPGGMTAWFLPEKPEGTGRAVTTAEVDHTWLNLPRGRFTGVVFDWSPAEYANQEFEGFPSLSQALVHVRAAKPQPAPDDDLYGSAAVPPGVEIPLIEGSATQHVLSVTPDPMSAGLLPDVEIITGTDGDLVRWWEREQYQASLVTQTFHCQPEPIIWDLRILIYVHGIENMKTVTATVAGMSYGNQLGTLTHSPEVCLHPLDDWTVRALGDGIGTISTTVHTFGLPPKGGTKAATLGESLLRLNLKFLLRDDTTVLYYHFDVGDESVTLYEDQMVVRIDIPIEWGPDLPYVDPKGATGFDASVAPWQDGADADVNM